ncbi:hypothetical protein ABT187_07425 [Streptomyces sp. NPDC001817]|uniref:hypothetical protein n=1 Tax=Streptomyces sp. NPDC001817 TaxID=3154398 RepID=UPI00332975E9
MTDLEPAWDDDQPRLEPKSEKSWHFLDSEIGLPRHIPCVGGSRHPRCSWSQVIHSGGVLDGFQTR